MQTPLELQQLGEPAQPGGPAGQELLVRQPSDLDDDAGKWRKCRDLWNRVNVRALFGLRAGQALWGLEPLDLGCCTQKGEQGSPQESLRNSSGNLNSSGETTANKSAGTAASPWYRVPEPLCAWGDEMPHDVHDRLGIFCDLIIVGLASRIGALVVSYSFECTPMPESMARAAGFPYWNCSADAEGEGSGEGSGTAAQPQYCMPVKSVVLVALAIFSSVTRLWLTEIGMKSRFRMDDRFHRALDLVGYFIFLQATSVVPTGAINRSLTTDCFHFVWLGSLLWWLRWLEIALFARQENARREAGTHVVDHGIQLLVMGVVLLLDRTIVTILEDYGECVRLHPLTPSECPLDPVWLAFVPFLMYGVAAIWTLAQYGALLRVLYRHLCKKCLAGPHWPLERISVPQSVHFITHRHKELLMIMLGESLLQMSTKLTDVGVFFCGHLRQYLYTPNGIVCASAGLNVAVIAGFILAFTLLYTFVLSDEEGTYAVQHPLSSRSGAVFKTFYSVNLMWTSFCILLIGVAVELGVSDPAGFECAPMRVRQQALVCLALMFATTFQLILHAAQARAYLGGLINEGQTASQNRRFKLLLLLRVVGYFAYLVPLLSANSESPMPYYGVLAYLAAVSVFNAVLVHVHKVRAT